MCNAVHERKNDMSEKIALIPIATGEYVVEGGDFSRILARSAALEAAGETRNACRLRFEAVQTLMAVLPENEDTALSWADAPTRDALTAVKFSAIDHFLVGDTEMAAAMFELLLELDSEDHLDATHPLAFCYIAMGEYELFDEIVSDLPEQSPGRALAELWSSFRRTGSLPLDALQDFPALLAEFRAGSHPADESYIADIDSVRPSREARARELWLQTEHLWRQAPGFIAAIKRQ
jgi:tetratricopeptide (TPR) repeat protein